MGAAVLMRIFTLCMECQKGLGHPSLEPIVSDYYDYIEYRDDRGWPRRTAFCRKYDPITRRFSIVDDQEYEYQE